MAKADFSYFGTILFLMPALSGRISTPGAVRNRFDIWVFWGDHVLRTLTIIALAISAPAVAQADRLVGYEADFESGQFMPAGSRTDSFFVLTLPDPQNGSETVKTGDGGGTANDNWDSRVLSRASLGGQTVRPRTGQYFALHTLHRDKDYTELNGNGEKKPRVQLNIAGDRNLIEFDSEVYSGFSIFVPNDFEHETGTTGHLGSSTLVVVNTDSSATLMTLRIYVPDGGTRAHWFLDYYVNPTSVEETPETLKTVDLGPVNPDRGKWTDFVIRFRSNPFSTGTNPARKGIANANDKFYEGNKGILQLWKAEGVADSNGNRKMVRKISVVNSPVGNVPGTTQGKSQLSFSLRIYKYKWQTMPTDVRGPIEFGFDAFRFGDTLRYGTSYTDVHPAQQPCTDRCPPGSNATDRPKPPELSFDDA
jgi:hypothetical protein